MLFFFKHFVHEQWRHNNNKVVCLPTLEKWLGSNFLCKCVWIFSLSPPLLLRSWVLHPLALNITHLSCSATPVDTGIDFCKQTKQCIESVLLNLCWGCCFPSDFFFFGSRVSSWWCLFLSPTLHQIHPIKFHYRISWQFTWSVIPSEENWMELFQPCCCPSVWVFIAFKRVLQFFNSFFRKEIKDILEVGKGNIYNFLITEE